MELYITSFVFVAFILFFSYGIMKAIEEQAGGNKKKRAIYFFIYFLICSFLYFAWESNQSNYDGQIQDYLYDIETSIDNIYDKLEDNYALDYVSEDLMDITQYTEEIYHIMN